MDLPFIVNKLLGLEFVSGRKRLAEPAAGIITLIFFKNKLLY